MRVLSEEGHDSAGGTGSAGGLRSSSATVMRTVQMYAISLPGSTRSADADITTADGIWRQCGISVQLAGGESWQTDVLDRQPPASALNDYKDPKNPTAEERAMLAHTPAAGMVGLYYVPALSSGARGEAFSPSDTPDLPDAVVIADNAASDSMAHELGHVLFDSGTHHADPGNLMAEGKIRNVGEDNLEAAQCDGL
jgi:hypothetical protein